MHTKNNFNILNFTRLNNDNCVKKQYINNNKKVFKYYSKNLKPSLNKTKKKVYIFLHYNIKMVMVG